MPPSGVLGDLAIALGLGLIVLVGSEQVDPAQGWRLIVVALLSNLVFKGAMAALLGDGRLRRWVCFSSGFRCRSAPTTR